jgi:ATP-dependent Clp protease ATP-binding subunit ClpA
MPLEQPHLTLHAASSEVAREDLTLALDDRIRRAHPRRIAEFARDPGGEAFTLEVPALRVWTRGGPTVTRPLKLTAVRRPIHGKFTEVFLPRLDLRVWVDGHADVEAQARTLALSLLESLNDDQRLRLRPEGDERFGLLELDSDPVPLSALRRKEMHLDERPFPPSALDALDDDDEEAEARDRARAERRRSDRARRATPALLRAAVPLHRRAVLRRLEPAWERDALVERLLRRLDGEEHQAVLLVGAQGAGKSAVLEELVRRLGDPNGPVPRRGRYVFAVDASRLIAGMGGFGEWEAQLHAMLEEASRTRAVLLLGDPSALLDAGRSAHSDHNVAQVLGPALAGREVTVLAEATPEAWARLQRRNQSFASVWSVVQVDELSPEATRRVLDAVGRRLEKRLGLTVDTGTAAMTLSLVRRFWPYGALLGNAVAFLKRLLAARAHARATEVRAVDAVEFFSHESGIPRVLLRDDLALDPQAVRAFLTARVLAQPEAVDRVTQVVSTVKAALQDPRKPVAVLVFAGPTGVGKTELAKALAEFVFSSAERLLRIDLGEYLGADGLARLLGGDGSAGLLPALVRRQPFCVLLLDEIEKAHPAVFDALLGVLGEGRLTDAEGRVTDFRNAIIVMTSNLGADTLRARAGFDADETASPEAVRRHYRAEAQRFFRPEFFNRIDDLIVFRPLGAEAVGAIVRREASRLADRDGFRRRDAALRVTDAALGLLADKGLDPRYGARPLKRTLERELVAPCATWLAGHRGAGALAMDVDRDPEDPHALKLKVTSRGNTAEGSRADIEAVLEDCADLRAELRRWSRSPAVTELRRSVAWFDQVSRSEHFWKDHALAEEASQRAARARTLTDEVAALLASTEAAEDLAVEAWYDRNAPASASLHTELLGLRARLEHLPEKIYLASRPRCERATLYVVAGRGSWDLAARLVTSWDRWAQRRGLNTQQHLCAHIDPKLRPGTKPDDPEKAYHWVAERFSGDENPAPGAAALEVFGGETTALLEPEAGAHRFYDGSAHRVVKALFLPATDPRAPMRMLALPGLLARLPGEEIRRYNLPKDVVRDARLGEDLELTGTETSYHPERFLARWVRHACLRSDDAAWI